MRSNRLKRHAGLLLGAALLLQTLLLPGLATAAEARTTITIVHVNDVHSRVEATDSTIGYAKLAAYVKKLRADNPNTLLLDAGDTLHGQTIANLERGDSIVRMLNAVGFDAMATGNHDYNYGYERLVELSGKADFPMLAANVYKEDGSRLFKPYVIETIGGAKVGIFGLATPETLYKTHPNNVKGLTFADPVEEAKKVVAELESRTDAIIALAHLGVDEASVDTSIELAEETQGIDLIVDGHSHTALAEGLQVGETLIVQAGQYSEHIGIVELTIGPDGADAHDARLIPVEATADLEPDAAVLDVIDSVKRSQEEILSEPVGESKVDLDGEREHVRTGETNLGNLIADAMLAETGADIALTNGGGIRASIPAGTVTKGQVITVLPFGNYIQTKKITGEQLLAALEHGTSAYPEPLGGFPHVAGVTFKLDPDQPAGSRVHSVEVQGKPLDPKGEYTLATNDFLAAGGDQYTMFMAQPVTGDFASLEEAVIAYMNSLGEVAPEAEGRVVIAPRPAAVPEGNEPDDAEPSDDQPGAAQPEAERVYIVKRGDTLWAIARAHGTTWQKLAELNKLRNPDLIFPGQRILLP